MPLPTMDAETPVSLTRRDAPPAPSRWRDRWLALRDRWLASPAFQRRAARWPIARGIARRRAAQVFDLVAGFAYSQVLAACVRLRLFDKLADGPQALDVLAARLGLEPAAAERLLVAAVALRLVERRSAGRFGLGVLGAPLVGNAGVAAMVEHHALLYADLADPVALLRGVAPASRLAGYWPYAGAADPSAMTAGQVASYSDLMAASQPLVAGEILEAVDFARHRCLLDVGGGDGSFLVAAAARAPSLRLVLFDLPAVAERAARRLAEAGLAQRSTTVGGNFVADPLPRGADIATLIRVLHDHDDARVATVLRAVHRALDAGGTLVVAEPMAETPGAESMGDAYFGFYLLAMGRGRPRSAACLVAMLRDAGFEDVRRVATAQPLQAQLLVARKPSAKTLHIHA
jgi:demethylspheroidene O-methyltransferase